MHCDFCLGPLEDDETGIFLVWYEKGGHIECAREFLAEKGQKV